MDLRKESKAMNTFFFSEKILSTNEDVRGTPYTVKDQFTISQAQMNQEYAILMDVLYNMVVEKYALTPKQASDITLVDIQYLLAKLKLNSDSESIPVVVKCENCGLEYSKNILINDIHVENYENFKRNITIPSREGAEKDIIISIKVTSFMVNKDIILGVKELSEESMIENVLNSIDSVTIGDETKTDFDRDELREFILSLPAKFVVDVEDFIRNSPKLIYSKTLTCEDKECGFEQEVAIQQFFFSLV